MGQRLGDAAAPDSRKDGLSGAYMLGVSSLGARVDVGASPEAL